MSKLYFSADLHFNHKNIINYCGRTIFMTKEDKERYNNYLIMSEEQQKDFGVSDKTLNNHNEGLIKRWNERVKPEDDVIHVGDFCWKTSKGLKAEDWKKRLNGNIILVKGNHDNNNTCKTKIYSLQLKIHGHYIHIVHDPLFANVNYEVNITGHVHEKWEIKRIRYGNSFTDCVNCGVDVWNYMPVTYDELKKRYDKWRKNLLS